MEDPVEVEKVIVAVHGVGDQTRFTTLQQVVSQFCRYHGAVAGVPLGNFHVLTPPPATPPIVLPLVLSTDYPKELRKFAFAEVYWADIAREIAEEKYSLEDVAPWVRTIVSRVRMHDLSSQKLTAEDQIRIEQVLGEMLQTITVLERLCFLADKMGLFSFDLKKILVDYADDVQIVAEFKAEGQKIGKVFEDRMATIHEKFPNAEIHIVSHSEGTVVSLLGLLGALCDPQPPEWIKNVRGFMTFGSPIDKHLILWPELFGALSLSPCELDQPIEWQNYYDFGDPVGFDLDTARETFQKPEWQGIFNFPSDHDHGFARYPMPGKAHVDYWNDPEVFGHFIQNVVYKRENIHPKSPFRCYANPPVSKLGSKIISWVGPYFLELALLFCAVLVLYNAAFDAVRPLTHPPAAAQPAAQTAGPVDVQLDSATRTTIFSVAAITCLLAGLTVAVRIPRLTKLKRWHLIGLAIFLLSVVANRSISCGFHLNGSSGPFRTCLIDQTIAAARELKFSMAGIAFLVLVAGYLVSRFKPDWGARALLIPGGIGTAYVLFHHVTEQTAKISPGHHVAIHELWPLFLAAAVFFYLWWLVALLFDLVFVWHRYIRYAGEGQYLSLPSSREAREKAKEARKVLGWRWWWRASPGSGVS
jgi:hypothetical protein